MSRATIRGVNAALAPRQIEMVKGNGYFYFMPTDTAPIDMVFPEIDSVYTCFISDMTKEQWVKHVESFFVELCE